MTRTLCILGLVLVATGMRAATPSPAETFIAAAFDGAPPAPTVLWYDPPRRAIASAILGHAPTTARIRVWRSGTRTALVLDEIAHTQPITAGFVVGAGRIEQARVLIYRESRGGTVQRAEWLAQLIGRGLDAEHRLDGEVDGLTGATLSVAAMTRMARLALYLAGDATRSGTTDAAH